MPDTPLRVLKPEILKDPLYLYYQSITDKDDDQTGFTGMFL